VPSSHFQELFLIDPAYKPEGQNLRYQVMEVFDEEDEPIVPNAKETGGKKKKKNNKKKKAESEAKETGGRKKRS